MADYYQVLGVPKTATAEQIRKAYKKIARENHPDVKPGDTAAAERFKQAAEAYDVLGDPDKRKQYDQYGEAFRHMRGGPPPGGEPFPGGGFRGAGPIDLEQIFGGAVDLEDIFGPAFGRGARRPRARRGADVHSEITVPFQLAATGGAYDVTIQRNGTPQRLSIKIPAGVHEGSVIRLGGEGEPGTAGGSPGDLLITIHVAPHPYFRRDGRDLILELPVTPSEAALGAKIDVPTLEEGLVTLSVPPGSSSGTKLRLRGKGIPDPKTKVRGDQFVIIKIVVPRQLNDRARELLRELEQAAPLSPRAGLW